MNKNTPVLSGVFFIFPGWNNLLYFWQNRNIALIGGIEDGAKD
jgi:hypothetical protein